MAATSPVNRPMQPLDSAPYHQLQEGAIQSCNGYLMRRTKILKRWKKAWISINPGPNSHNIVADGKQLYSFPAANPGGIQVESLSSNPKDKNFFAFAVVKSSSGKEKCRFRVDNIVQMRRFMACLGTTGGGLFTKKTGEDEIPVEATHGKWDIVHPSEDKLEQRQQQFDKHEKDESQVMDAHPIDAHPTDAPPTYADTIQQLPIGFYFHKDLGISPPSELTTTVTFPGQDMPIYNPAVSLPKAFRRARHDTFRPPNGPPTFVPISIGYGSEVGLKPGQQALWDPMSKIVFFLDHTQQITFYDDPRPVPIPRPVVKYQQQIYGDNHRETSFPQNMCTYANVLKETAERARSKPHGCTLVACGRYGSKGADGKTGNGGSNGCSGKNASKRGGTGGNGEGGGPGGPGSEGLRGGDATSASDIIVELQGGPSELKVTGSTSFVAKLGGLQAEEVLFVNCRGGDGGKGGCGGDGGQGGSGGQGGHGGRGKSRSSGPGGTGGTGGNGGNGGPGGPGGKGGDGGHAGHGGRCVIETVDPRLLVLVEADCTAGNKGIRGDGGNGGLGGVGGNGGDGGPGGEGGSTTDSRGHRTTYPRGSSGPSGFRGQTGPRGTNGPSGTDGNTARDGGILWSVCSADGSILHQAGTRYDAQVEGLSVVSAIDDGIFEPNEKIMVSSLTVLNSGGLPLPAGSQAFIPSTHTVRFEPTKFDMPEILPVNKFEIPITYSGRIFDYPPPNKPGPFVSSAEFNPRVELLGRPFEKSFFKKMLIVQYPVKLTKLKHIENLGRGEVALFEVGVQNISKLPYGACPGSGGRVALQIHFDARLIPVGASNGNATTLPYTVTYNPNIQDSMFIELQEIPAMQTVTVYIAVQMESRAELFGRCYWQADLYLRDKLIEYNFESIRVAPFYIPNEPAADILMVTNEHITRKEFVFWQRILELADVSVDFWDTTRYNGLSVDATTNSPHPINSTWKGRYNGKMILYPYCNLNYLWGVDIVHHFHGENHCDALREQNSSMVLMLPPSQPCVPQLGQNANFGDKEIIRHLSGVNASIELPRYSGFHCFKPGTFGCCTMTPDRPYLQWEEKQLKKLEKRNPSQSATVFTRNTNISCSYLCYYKYGQVDIRRMPLLRSSKLLVLDGAGGSVMNMSYDDIHLKPTSNEIPLASNFGQIFVAVLFGLPMKCKVALLKKPEGVEPPPPQVQFILPNGLSLSRAELAMICAASEIADDLFSCSGIAQRMNEFAQEITTNTAEYVENGGTILRGMMLLENEAKGRKKRLKNNKVNRALRNLLQQKATVKRTLESAGVNGRNLQPIVSLDCLMDRDTVHKSCQHRVDDKRWNIPG